MSVFFLLKQKKVKYWTFFFHISVNQYFVFILYESVNKIIDSSFLLNPKRKWLNALLGDTLAPSSPFMTQWQKLIVAVSYQ